MARGPNKFRQREITRTIKAAKAAGEKVNRVEVEPDGKIVLYLGAGRDSPNQPNDADIALAKMQQRRLNTADAILEELERERAKKINARKYEQARIEEKSEKQFPVKIGIFDALDAQRKGKPR
jgi:hypothetical protein